MSTWDEEKLRDVVARKQGGQGYRVPTTIICKHFLEARHHATPLLPPPV